MKTWDTHQIARWYECYVLVEPSADSFWQPPSTVVVLVKHRNVQLVQSWRQALKTNGSQIQTGVAVACALLQHDAAAANAKAEAVAKRRTANEKARVAKDAARVADELATLAREAKSRALASDEVQVYVDYAGTIWTNEMQRQDPEPRAAMIAEIGRACAGRSVSGSIASAMSRPT